MKKIVYLFSFFFMSLLTSCADEKIEEMNQQSPLTRSVVGNAFAVNQQLKRGINIGDTFETGNYEGIWNSMYFRYIAAMGFTHVRIPIHWETRVVPGTDIIEPDFMQKMKNVVTEALRYDLYVIINMHNHLNLMNNPGQYQGRFLSQWRQIAEAFSSYSDKLLFEILNEPGSAITPELWHSGLNYVYPIIRQSNPNRIILVGTPYGGGISGLGRLQLPFDDDKTIVTVHYYNPFTFTHQGASWVGGNSDEWLGTEWHDTEAERMTVDWDLKEILAFERKNNVPIHMGEFGAYEKADMDSRVRWTTYLARQFEQHGFSWVYWELYAGFGIYDLRNQMIRQQLLDALVTNPIPEATTYTKIPVYHADFSENEDGWYLLDNERAGANAFMTRSNGKLVVNISSIGTYPSQIQLVRIDTLNRIPTLVNGQHYLVTFKSSSRLSSRTVTGPYSRWYNSYVGQNYSPWNAYSTIKRFAIGEEEEVRGYLFYMNEDTDTNCRIFFDLGAAPGIFTLSEFTLDIVEF